MGTWDRTRSTTIQVPEGRATYSSTMGLPAKPCAPGILVLWTPPNPLKKSQVARLNSTNSVETHQTTEIQCWESLTQRRCEGTTYSLRRTDAGLTRACTETSCALAATAFLEDEIDCPHVHHFPHQNCKIGARCHSLSLSPSPSPRVQHLAEGEPRTAWQFNAQAQLLGMSYHQAKQQVTLKSLLLYKVLKRPQSKRESELRVH